MFLFLFFFCALIINVLISQPNTISGLSLWLKSDYGVTTLNNKVTTWLDASGNNNHCNQTDTSMSPTYITNIVSLNNQASLVFDGVDDYIPFTTRISTIRTVFFIVKHYPSSSNFEPILGDNIGTDFLGDDYPVTNRIFHNSYTSPNILNGGIRINQVNITPVILSQRPSNYSIITLTTTANVAASQITRDRGIGSRVWKGEYSEIIIYDQPLSPIQTINIETYLINKYAPTLNLGPDITVQQMQGCAPSNSISIQANPNFVSYSWSTGENTNQIIVNQYSEYSVVCKDIFGINHYDTINVLPIPKNFNYPVTIICGSQSIIWNTNLSKNQNIFTWQDNSTDSLFIINSPGQYFVKIIDNFGCEYTSDTITITQDNFPTIVSLGSDTSICVGNRIGLVNGNQAGLSYLWNNNATDSALVINASGQYNITVTNQNNCVAKDTINVIISGQAPIAGFENTPTCLNTSIQFTDTSRVTDGSTINQWFWDFGNTSTLADTSILDHPSYIFADTGSYQITLRVKSTQGCTQSIQKNIRVYPKPIVDFFSSIACQNDTTSFFSTINALGYPTNSVTWNFGDPTSGNNNQSSLANSTHIFSQTGNYQIKLTAENNMQCKDSISKTISVKNEVNANFNFSTACVGAPITFTDNSIVPAPNNQNVRLWNFYPGSSGGLSVNKTYASAGTYSVTLTVNGFNGCISSITKNIEVHLPPVADFAIDTICKNDTVLLQDLSLPQQGSLSSWQWKLNNQLIAQVQQPTYVFNSSGNFNLKLITQNSFGCIDSISKNSTVYSLPNALISSNTDPYYFIGEPVQFNASSANFSSYFWIIDSTTIFSIPQPNFTFNTTGDFPIQLTVEDSLGCLSTGNKTISVSARLLDLSVKNALATIDTFGFAKVIAELYNLGTSPITTFEIMYELTGAEKVKEIWNGLLPPNSIMQYTFNRQVYLEEYLQKNAINCIRVLSVNSIQDANLKNNQTCASLINNENIVADPYPNPSKNIFTIPINLKETQSIQFEVKDVLGKSIVIDKITGNKGINLVQLHAEKWENGVYFLSIQLNEKELFLKKLIKN